MPLQALILAGSQSSRIGARKELLRLTSNSPPLFLHLALVLKRACPELDVVHVSLKDRTGTLRQTLTCYRNAQGHYEPPFAIWTPAALGILDANMKWGNTGPRIVIQELDSRGLGELRVVVVVVPREEM
ncbi:hypothetical protein RJZ56_002424 [Blastomyces dermatitidis]